jgi:hypothetical protein
MKTYVLWVRHCESCSNVVIHSKYKKRWITDTKQGFEIPPNCTLIGLIQSFMFGYKLLPELLRKYPQFKQIDYFCSLLKRTMITNKLISRGLEKSKYKVKTSKEIGRICNISERQTIYEKYKKIEFNRSSVRTSNKFVKEVNKKYKRTGKNIATKIKKRTKNCKITDHDMFVKESIPLLNSKSLNIIVSHGIILKKIFKLKGINNVDAVLAEYDTNTGKYKMIDKIKNHSNLSDDTNSHTRIKKGNYQLHYKSKNINLKTDITIDQFIKFVKPLNKKINFKGLDNEITCDK